MSTRVAAALGASVGLHLIGLGVLFALRPAEVTPVLAPSPPATEWVSVDLAPRQRSQPAPTSAVAPRAPAPKRRAPTTVVEAAGAPEPELVEVGLAAPSPGVGGEGGALAAFSAPGAPGGAGIGTSDAAGLRASGSGGGADLGADLGALHARLSAAAARCYPASARRFRMRGETLVSFCTSEGGEVSRIEQKKSSGSPLLDRAALECVLPRAAPLPGPAGCFTAPIVFGDAR